jgi:tetratricopeptide (TPR) repeat protein
MEELSGELAYLFRHPLLREAAYQLQLPSSRARLHGLVLAILEGVLNADQTAENPRLAAAAAELADHALAAQNLKSLKKEARQKLAQSEVRYRMLAAAWAAKMTDLRGAVTQYEKIKAQKLAGEKDAAIARWHLGVRQTALGLLPAAFENLQEALVRARKLGDEILQTSVELELGNLELARGQPDAAMQLFTRALAAARAAQNAKLESVALGGLAGIAYRKFEYANAVQGYRDALAASERAGDSTNRMIHLTNVANALYQAEFPVEGLAMAKQACEQALAHGLIRLHVIARTNYATFLEDAGRIDEAQAEVEIAEREAERVGTQFSAGLRMDLRARIEMRKRNWEAASQWLVRGLDASRETGQVFEEARCHARLAVVLAHMGRKEEATVEWDTARTQFDALHSPELGGKLTESFNEAMKSAYDIRQ